MRTRLQAMRFAVLAAVTLLLLALPPAARAQTKSVSWQQVVVTPNASAYSAGQCIGGVLTLPAMFNPQGPGGTVLTSFTFVDPQHQSTANDALSIWIFNAPPSGSYTDHAGCAVAAADLPILVGVITVASSNCAQDSGPATTICTINNFALALAGMFPVINPNLYAVAIAAGTPTYGSSAKLYFNFMATPFAF